MVNHCVKDNRSHQYMVLIGNGKRTVFWLDTWIDNYCLVDCSLIFSIYPMIKMPALTRWECGMGLNGSGFSLG
jgi:hypothetical protein